jgi:BlaI family penicillinase repressor
VNVLVSLCGNFRTFRLTPVASLRKYPHMRETPLDRLSRRERQIMEIVYEAGSASAAEVQSRLSDSPGYSAVRSALRLLEQRGLLTHRREGLRYVFAPKIPGERAKVGALRRVVSTFFQNSAMEAMQTLLSDADLRLSEGEIAKIEKLLKEAKRRS